MAGVSSKEIKSRIRSMESTKQITKAMEMVAASKLRQAQGRIASSRPYFQILQDTIRQILQQSSDFSSPYLEQRQGDKTLVIVIAGDRGQAGGYNSNVLKRALAVTENTDATFLPLGKKAVDYFTQRGAAVFGTDYKEAADLGVGDCFTIAKTACRSYLAGQFDRICLCYTNFVSVLSQTPECLQLLPLEGQQPDGFAGGDILYEPDPVAVFDAIVPEYLGGVLYGALCESRASEQAARRTAMDSATQNAEDMIADLSLKFNRARQGAITQEITEIVAGAEA